MQETFSKFIQQNLVFQQNLVNTCKHLQEFVEFVEPSEQVTIPLYFFLLRTDS